MATSTPRTPRTPRNPRIPRDTAPRRTPWILVALLLGAIALWFALNFGAAASSGSIESADPPTTGPAPLNDGEGGVPAQRNDQAGSARP